MFDSMVFSQEFPKLKSITTNRYMMKIRTESREAKREIIL
jgi:hypothetical protein